MTADAAAYPTRFPLVELTCSNYECRVQRFTGTPVHPLICCPLCQRVGTATDGARP